MANTRNQKSKSYACLPSIHTDGVVISIIAGKRIFHRLLQKRTFSSVTYLKTMGKRLPSYLKDIEINATSDRFFFLEQQNAFDPGLGRTFSPAVQKLHHIPCPAPHILLWPSQWSIPFSRAFDHDPCFEQDIPTDDFGADEFVPEIRVYRGPLPRVQSGRAAPNRPLPAIHPRRS